MKIVIAYPKTGKSFQKEISDDVAKNIKGKKIGETVKGEIFDYTGYEMKITGGSDKAGFPMRHDIEGESKKKVLIVEGKGVKRKVSKTKKGKMRFKGVRQRKTVAGNTVADVTSQINLMITKDGKEAIPELQPKKEEEKKEEKK